LSGVRVKKVDKEYIYPYTSVVIAAFNEEKNIGRRLDDLLKQDYPSDKMEIIIVSDGSVDKTEEIVRTFLKSTNNIHLYSLKEKKGKAIALNIGVSHANGEIIVFTDARQTFRSNLIKELVANFHDTTIGAVSGELYLASNESEGIEKSIALYWNYEKYIRKIESKTGSVVGVTGAVYAIRKRLFEPLPEKTILDDVYIPMKIILKGYRVVFEEKAVACDNDVIDSRKEFRRKVRTLTGNYQLIFIMPEIISFKNSILLRFISHKMARLIAPFFFITLFFSNIFLVKDGYLFSLIVQLIFYSIAAVGSLFQVWVKQKKLRLLYFPYTFVLLSYAAIVGFINFVRNKNDVWVKD
jgi:cellulose synthase/poly-beta-1,6-N-acetylglucosamine synthase-like glycosyltransferase